MIWRFPPVEIWDGLRLESSLFLEALTPKELLHLLGHELGISWVASSARYTVTETVYVITTSAVPTCVTPDRINDHERRVFHVRNFDLRIFRLPTRIPRHPLPHE